MNKLISVVNKHLRKTQLRIFSQVFSGLLVGLIFGLGWGTTYSQTIYEPNNFTANQPNNNSLANSTAFKQEIARMEITVEREGFDPMPITKVPRLQKDDVLNARLIDEPVNGIKPDQSNYDWTFLVAYINPGRNSNEENTVSEEIQFRKTGWYKEYSFVVPYDSLPVFFLYPKPNYRDKILKLVAKNKDEIRKIGEKTIEISSAYAKIGSFLNELQAVVNRNQHYNTYSGYGNNLNYGNNNFNRNQFMEQSVERLARSFNIQLPGCWQNGSNYYNPGNYSGYTYPGSSNGNNKGTGNLSYNNYTNDFAGKIQCVAKSVRIEDLDFSISQMLQQGGILLASQLAQKYPQIAFWINIVATAIDFIQQLTKKTPLKLVPTVISTNENRVTGANPATVSANYQMNYSGAVNNPLPQDSVKISLFAELSPGNSGLVTAYPLVVHKWQADADPETINFPAPMLMETCLRPGQNVLRSADLMTDWLSDNFTKDFQLVISSPDGFRKQFPLQKNIGLSGWEFNLTKEDLDSLAKNKAVLEAVIKGKRGFSELQSSKFRLPVESASSWEIDPQTQKAFVAGGKRTVSLVNKLGGCKCLQQIVYKPSPASDGNPANQVTFQAGSAENNLQFSYDGTMVSFEIDASDSMPGIGQLELKQSSGESVNLKINLFPVPPIVSDLKIHKGDKTAVLVGERLEQIQSLKINGEKAVKIAKNSNSEQFINLVNVTVAESYNTQALEQFINGQYSEAFELFNKAVIAAPKNAMYHYNLGAALIALLKFSEAEKAMLEATKIEPSNSTYKIGLEAARQNLRNFLYKF